MSPYYEDEHATIYHGDCRDVIHGIDADVMLTDPPFGMAYRSGRDRTEGNARGVEGDLSTELRDAILDWWGTARPALVFGHWSVPHPTTTKFPLIWNKGRAVGMGDLSIPWKPCTEEIYVIGSGFVGRRDSGSVLNFPPVQTVGRLHPNAKPVDLIVALLSKCPPGTVLDPFMGSGTTLVAAKNLGRRSIGIEIEERYCEIAAQRLSQEVLDLGGAA